MGTVRNVHFIMCDQLRAELQKVYNDPGIRKRLEAEGMDPIWMGSAEISAAVERDLEKWSRVVQRAGIKAE
jgi:tripartite-type tricarboxylate transporter receptor subunit TctC